MNFKQFTAKLNESATELDKHISDFSKGVKSSAAKHSTYKSGGGKIHNMKHVETDSDHQKVFDHLKKMGYKKTSGYDPKPNQFDMHHNRDSMTSKSDPVHHSSGVSAHIEQEHGGKMKVHFTHRHMKEEVELDEATTGATKLVHTRKGADGAKYHIMQDSPTDYSIHREHKGKTTHIDTYSSLHRAKSVLDNEVKEEVELDEATVNTKKYSWGTMKTVHHGADFSIPLHPEHHQAIAKLKDEQEHHFKDETGRHWTARRKGEDVHFQGANGGSSTTVKHSTMSEEIQIDEAGYGRNRGYAHGFASPHAPSLGGRREREDDEGWDREPKHADQPHAVHINGKKWKSYGSQSHATNVAKKIKGATVHKEETELDEVLNPSMGAGEYIKDFQKSDAPQFKGKSKEKKRMMGIAAYLQAKRDMKEQAPVAPTIDKKYIKGTPENKAHKEKNKPINGHPTNKMKEEVEMDEDISKMSTDKLKKHWDTHKDQTGASPVFATQLKKVAKELAKRKALNKEEVELDEAFINGREYASHGLMHPDHAKMDIHQPANREVDFYASKTGNKMSGKVMKNDGKQVHIQAHKELGDGKLHKFKVTPHLPKSTNEEVDYIEELNSSDIAKIHSDAAAHHAATLAKKPEQKPKSMLDKVKDTWAKADPKKYKKYYANEETKKQDAPFDGPYKKTPGSTTDKSGAVHTPMSRARHLARMAMQKKMKEEFDVEIDDALADSLVETVLDENIWLDENLVGGQKKLDKNNNGKLDAEDFKKLRKEEKECPDCHKPMSKCECSMNESIDFDDEGNLVVEKISYTNFIRNLQEIKLSDLPVRKVTGRAYGGGAQKDAPEHDEDDDKPKAKPEPAEKRGRGRPVGSKSGANQKVTSGTKRSGVDYTGYKLHLPNTNKSY